MKKYWKHIVIVGLLLVTVFQCASNKEGSSKLVSVIKAEKRLNDSINIANGLLINKLAERDLANNILKQEKAALENKIVAIQKNRDVKLAEAKTFDVSGQQKFWDARYPTTDEPKIQLAENQSAPAITDLINGDAAVEENGVLREVINTQQEEIDNHVYNAADLRKISANLELAVKAKQGVIDEQGKELKASDSQLGKQKNKTLFYQITTVAAILGGGYLLIR